MWLNVVSLVVTAVLQVDLAIRVPMVVYKTLRRSQTRSSDENSVEECAVTSNGVTNESFFTCAVSGDGLDAVVAHAPSNHLAIVKVPQRTFNVSSLELPPLSSLMSQLGLKVTISRLLGLLFYLNAHIPFIAIPGDENSAIVATAIWAVHSARELINICGVSTVEMLEIRYLADIISARLALIQQHAAASCVATAERSSANTIPGSSSPLLLTYNPPSTPTVTEDVSCAAPSPSSSPAAAPAPAPAKPANRRRRSKRCNTKRNYVPSLYEEIREAADFHASGVANNIGISESNNAWFSRPALHAFRRLAAACIALEWRIAEMSMTNYRMGLEIPSSVHYLHPVFADLVKMEIAATLAALDAVCSILAESWRYLSPGDIEQLEWMAAHARGSIFKLNCLLPMDFYADYYQEAPVKQGMQGARAKLESAASLTSQGSFAIKANWSGLE